MLEPKYDEDTVNLGYLKKVISDTEEEIDSAYKNVSRHYAGKPQPPYYEGDTWIDGDIVYTCINTRAIGLYQDSDWVTESGAKAEAESKNKTYLTQPSNYNPGDMWILQSDEDHKAGKKGEILISLAGRAEYNEDDWINMLGYGTAESINEVADNLNNAINRIGNVEDAIEDGLIITFYQDSEPEGKHIGDLWYVTGEVEGYVIGKIYRYNGTDWIILEDPAIQEAFDEANEARLVADGKIQSFYSDTEPTQDMGVGDLWIDLDNNNQLYRYNGTNWVAVYDTRINDLVTTVESVTERVTTIETDLGEIDLKVQETTTKITTIEEDVSSIEDNVDTIDGKVSTAEGNISNLEGNVSNLEGNVSTLEGNVSTIQDNVSSLEGNVTTLEGNINDVETIANNAQSTANSAVEQIVETTEKLAEQKIAVDGVVTQVSDITSKTDELTGEVSIINSEINTVKQTIEGWTQELKNTGGNNIFYYSLDFWDNNNGLEEYSDTEIIQNSISQLGYILNNGSAKQSQSVKNGFYTCSFNYKKLLELAVCQVKINGTTYSLSELEWTEFEQIIEVTTNTIEIEFISDTDNSLYISDLMVNIGTTKLSWSQNANETRTDTVIIGKGIQVNSSAKNTYHRIDADGNRTFNKATGKVVNEATDKGSEMEELVVRGQAKINGLLMQKVSDQVWINNIL